MGVPDAGRDQAIDDEVKARSSGGCRLRAVKPGTRRVAELWTDILVEG